MLKIIATISAIQGAVIILNLLRAKIVAVLLGPAGVGIFSVVDQAIQLLIHISTFSLPFVAAKFLARAHSRGFEAFRKSYGSFLRLLVGVTAIGTAIGVSIVLWRPELLGSELFAYRAFLLPALLNVPIMALHGFFSSVLAAAQKAKASALMAFVVAFFLMVAAYAGISLGGMQGFYWSSLLANLSVFIGIAIYLKKSIGLPILMESHGVRRELLQNPDIVTFSLILYGASFASPFSHFVARYAVLTGFGEAEAGLLQAAFSLSSSLSLLLGSASNLYLAPFVNREIPSEEKLRVVLEFQGKLMVALGILAMPMVLFPHWLLVLFFSSSFVAVSPAVFIFVIAQFLLSLGWVYQALIIGFDDLKVYAVILALGYLVFGMLSWMLAPHYSIFGVAIGFLSSNAIIFLLTWVRLSRAHGLKSPVKLNFLLSYELLALLLASLFFNHYDPGQPWVIFGKCGVYLLFVASLLTFLKRK